MAVDTNILVRYLIKDVCWWLTQKPGFYFSLSLRQGLTQETGFLSCKENQPCLISNIVICELVWVLRGGTYGFRKDEIINALETMLHSSAFEFENRSTFYQALQRYKQGRADFSDYLIGAIAAQKGCVETVSFDRKLKNEKGFRCLE